MTTIFARKEIYVITGYKCDYCSKEEYNTVYAQPIGWYTIWNHICDGYPGSDENVEHINWKADFCSNECFKLASQNIIKYLKVPVNRGEDIDV